MMGDQFLRKSNDRKGKEGGDDHRKNAADERDDVGGGLRVFPYNPSDTVIHLYAFLGPNDAKEYPRPNQHDEDAKKQQNVGSRTRVYYFGSVGGHRFCNN